MNRVETSFAQRLNEICTEKGLPEHGRQSQLAKLMSQGDDKLTPNAARKWLLGEGMPELARAVRLADWAGVNINWLLQGVGPKRGDHIDADLIGVTQGIDELPKGDRQQVLDFIRYKFDRADGWFAAEKLGRYVAMLDKIAKHEKDKGSK